MEAQSVVTRLSGFSQFLVANNIIGEKQATSALKEAANQNTHLIIYLTKTDLISPRQLATATAEYFGLPLFDLDSYDTSATPIEALQASIVNQQYALPMFINDKYLYVAVTDPTLPNLNEISFITGYKISYVIVEADKLRKVIDSLTDSNLTSVFSDISNIDLENIDLSDSESDSDENLSSKNANDAPVVKYINKILLDAIHKNASDIHFEPFEKFYRIRFRQDGILDEVANPPIKLAQFLTARLKIMANLDISERRMPQDGRFKLNISKKRGIDFRVSTCPTLYGEKIVLRILDSSTELLDFNRLGLEEIEKNIIQHEIKRSQGMILVTGPTGSGKTVSLYTALNMLNVTEKNISTIEDPIEIQLPGINQVQINMKTGLTFASALRAFLRQDPDIIMVGEIRDLETAEISVKAAQTGHLLLSTLHTNSAPETLVRLSNMGVPAYNIASSIALIIAQRLTRQLCEYCKKSTRYPDDVLLKAGFKQEDLKNLTLFEPIGCEKCLNGYKGRIGIYEVIPISDEIQKIILASGSALDIAKQARQEGHLSLRDAGLEKVKQGITTLEEVDRVITV